MTAYGRTGGSAAKPWTVNIARRGKYRNLGCFAREEDAAKAYDRAALEDRGYKAIPFLNFPIAVYQQQLKALKQFGGDRSARGAAAAATASGKVRKRRQTKKCSGGCGNRTAAASGCCPNCTDRTFCAAKRPRLRTGRTCATCGATSTSCWRLGKGDAIACNACGLYWHKHGKERQASDHRNTHPSSGIVSSFPPERSRSAEF